MLNYELPRQNLPFISGISVSIFIELLLLVVCYRKGNGDPFCPGVMSWGIQFGTKDDWRYFTCDSKMSSMGLFYEQLRLRDSLEEISLLLTRSGLITVSNDVEICFKFCEVRHKARDYLPPSYKTSFDPTQTLSSIVQNSKSGILTLFPIFRKDRIIDSATEDAFKSYLARGELLKKPVILDNDEEEPSGKAFKEALDSLCKIASQMAAKGCFTAICTPSYSGKTQLAFSVDRSVIYLPLLLDFSNAQSIYRGFEKHVTLIFECVSFDHEVGRNIVAQKFARESKFPFLTCHRAADIFETDNKSLTVGYFFTILQLLSHSMSLEGNPDAPNEDPQRSFLERFWKMEGIDGTAILPRTIRELREEFQGLTDCFVFLDEFPSFSGDGEFRGVHSNASAPFSHLAATLRNIIRAMKLVCVVMGTDTRLANLTGARYMSDGGSREGLQGVWCALITQFPRVPTSFFTHHAYKDFSSVKDLIGKLESFLLEMPMTPWCKDRCNRAIAKELGQFFMEQLHSSRPGLAWELVSIIYDHRPELKSSSSVIELLHFICNQFFQSVFSRKKLISEFGTVCSLLGNRLIGYYNAAEFSKSAVEFHKLIDRHFYYIKSPFYQVQDIQVLYLYSLPASEKDLHANSLIQSNFPFAALDDMNYENYLSSGRYGAFQSFLPSPEEEFFLDAILWNDWGNAQRMHVYSNHNSVGVAMRRHFQHSASLISTDGKAAEEIWSSVVINASHRNKFYPLVGEFFLRTVILSAENHLTYKKCSIKLIAEEQEKLVRFPPTSSLKQQLNECVIPYLSAAGSFFSEILYSSFPSVFGKCIRTKNADMVDFAYEMKVLNRQDGQLYSAIGLVEMKDWQNELSEKNIAEILRRIPFSEYSVLAKGHFWGRCKLHFIFCRSLKSKDLIHKNENERVVNMKCLSSRGFSRRGYPLNEVEDSSTYAKFVEDQREFISKKRALIKRVEECQKEIDYLKKRGTDSSTEMVRLLEEQLKQIKTDTTLINYCYVPYDESADNITLEETEKEKAKNGMPSKDISLRELLADQKINLYYVDEIASGGLYELKVLYEDPSHDLISIIIPLQKSLAHMGNDGVSGGDSKDKKKGNDITVCANDSLDVDCTDNGSYEEFNSYLTEELINAIGNLYLSSPPEDGAQNELSAVLSVKDNVNQDNSPDNVLPTSQVSEQYDSDSDNGASVPPKFPKIN